MLVYRYDDTYTYVGSEEAYLDVLETELQGKDIYLIPANCTEVEPPAYKEGYVIKFTGSGWQYEALPKEPEPIEPPEPTLEDIKAAKITELKATRDRLEVEPLNNFDVDTTSLQRIDIASKILATGTVPSLEWTMANNTVQEVTSADFTNLYVALATRSNSLHEEYRGLKELVNEATTADEVAAITWEVA